LAEVREAEAIEAKRAALDPETEARRRKAVVGLGGKMQWENGVEEALKKASQRSDDGWLVTLVGRSACQYELY
jgi:twinfilin-like protein